MAERPRTVFHNCKDQEEVDAFLKKVEPGDALEFRRTGFYHHWGICTGRNEVGEIEVAHVSAPEDTSYVKAAMAASGSGAKVPSANFLQNIGKPFKEALRYVMSKQNFVRVNNSIDNHIIPFAVNVILERVNRTLQDGGWGYYHFALNNCEHYVNYCRNGKRLCLQPLQKVHSVANLTDRTLGNLITGVRNISKASPVMASIFAPVDAGVNVAARFLANTQRQFSGKPVIQNISRKLKMGLN